MSKASPRASKAPIAFLLSIALTIAALLSLSSPSQAQVPDPITVQQEPVPGVDHHYIGIGAETVNPADGSVTFDLPITTPAGRQLSFPFGIRHSTTEAFSLNQATGPTFVWQVSRFNSGYPFSLNGWSFDLPYYTAQAYTSRSEPDPQGGTDWCWSTNDYMFHGFNNVSAYLGVNNNWADPNNKYNIGCNTNGSAAGGGYHVAASLVGTLGTQTQPTLTATDMSGTVYQFPGTSISLNPGSGVTGQFGGIAQTITDKNGNQMVFNGLNDGNGFHPGSYTDTVGRTLLSWSGMGSGTGDQITISGLTGNIVVKWTTITVTYPTHSVYVAGTQSCSIGSGGSSQISVVSEIDLPNGTKYTFAYGGTYNRLNKITFPGGGYVRYVWGANPLSQLTYQIWSPTAYSSFYCYAEFDTPAITDRYVSYDGTTEVLHQAFSYSTTYAVVTPPAQPYWSSKKTTVTSTDLVTSQTAVTKYTYTYNVGGGGPLGTAYVPQIPAEQTIVYQDGSGNTLKTVNKSWHDQYFMVGEQEISSTGQGKTTLRCPDGMDQVLATYEYGFQAEGTKPADPACSTLAYGLTLSSGMTTSAMGPLKRQTVVAYHNFGSTNIRNEPDSVTVSDGSGNEVKQTTYAYDETATVASNAVTGLVAPPGTRGNATTVSQWLNPGSTFLKRTYSYFDTGQVQTVKDACGNTTCSDMSGSTHTTTYSYTDAYTKLSGGSNIVYVPTSGNTNAYPTQISNALGQTETFTYDFNNGQVTKSTDANSQSTTYIYNDNLARLTKSTYPDGGSKALVYNDAKFNATTPSPSVTTTTAITSSVNKVDVVAFDGMNHTVETILSSDPIASTYTTTTFNGLGQTYKATNPHRTATNTTDGTTTYTYDALGRTTKVAKPDGSAVTTAYDQTNASSTGVCSTATDESGKARQSCSDGLGRLTGVWEDPGSSPHLAYETDYGYDTLDNLLSVTQKGSSSSSARVRSFQYDSLSRLTSASNPESGTISYVYDSNGNLSSKTAPSPNQPSTGSATVTTSYTYDVLNRLTYKSYVDTYTSNPTTSTSSYAYDGNTLTGCNPPTLSDSYAKGRRTAMCDGSGATKWSHDTMGRIVAENRTIDGQTQKTSYSYNYDGSLATIIYPGTLETLTYTTGADGRPTAVQDNGNVINYVGSATYAPPGELTSMLYGKTTGFAGITTTNAFNDRLQPILLSAASPTGTVFSVCYDFHLGVAVNTSPCSFTSSTLGDNGNVYQVVNKRSGYSGRTQNFMYDVLNRIQQAYSTDSTWGETFSPTATAAGVAPTISGIDAWGNLINRSGVTGKTNGELFSATVGTNNQLGGFTYDAAGNLHYDGSTTYNYDAENRLVYVNSYNYYYDGDGNRVAKTSGSTGTLYWRGPGGEPISESSVTGSTQEEYIFFGGGRVARKDIPSNAVHYYFADFLGSHGVVENATGSTCEQDIDYYPYGGVIHDYCATVTQHYRYTGKERDSESGLDNFEARYLGSSLGRFMSPDPMGGHKEDPQTLNKYAYVRNNPLNLTDPTGLDFNLTCSGKDTATCHGGVQGTTTTITDANGNQTSKFTATQIGDDGKGGLVDKTTNTGAYTASVGQNGVSFSQDGGKTSSAGVFANGTDPTHIQGSGDLAGFSFTFTNSKMEANQTAAGTFTFAGTPDQAGAALQKAGFQYYPAGENPGMNEYRSSGSFWTSANSGHFNLYEINLKPWLGVPQSQGDMHFGEHNPFTSNIGSVAHCAPSSVGGDGACH